MLKSLLGYQAGAGGGANESVMRKKLYENAINNALKNSFPAVLKVRPSYFRLNLQLTDSPSGAPQWMVWFFQVAEELVDKWSSVPEDQHIPLCAHLLGLALKTVTQLALGERFKDDAEVISFRKNHEAVRTLSEAGLQLWPLFTFIRIQQTLLLSPDLVGDRERLHGRLLGEELQ